MRPSLHVRPFYDLPEFVDIRLHRHVLVHRFHHYLAEDARSLHIYGQICIGGRLEKGRGIECSIT